MTDKEIIASVEAYQHYLNTGSLDEIEFYSPDVKWAQKTTGVFDSRFKYRIKPKPPEPKYRPFKSADEFNRSGIERVSTANEWKNGLWTLVTQVTQTGVFLDNSFVDFIQLYHGWETVLGTPCGVLVEEKEAE